MCVRVCGGLLSLLLSFWKNIPALTKPKSPLPTPDMKPCTSLSDAWQCLDCRDWQEQYLWPHICALRLPEPQSHFGSALDLSQPTPPCVCTGMCSMGCSSGGCLSLSSCSATSLLPPPGTSQQPSLRPYTRSSGNPSVARGWYDPSTTLFTSRECSSSYCGPQDVFSPFLINLVWIFTASLTAVYMCMVSAGDDYGGAWKCLGLLCLNG